MFGSLGSRVGCILVFTSGLGFRVYLFGPYSTHKFRGRQVLRVAHSKANQFEPRSTPLHRGVHGLCALV